MLVPSFTRSVEGLLYPLSIPHSCWPPSTSTATAAVFNISHSDYCIITYCAFIYYIFRFLADHTNGRAYATVLRLSVRLSVTLCIDTLKALTDFRWTWWDKRWSFHASITRLQKWNFRASTLEWHFRIRRSWPLVVRSDWISNIALWSI